MTLDTAIARGRAFAAKRMLDRCSILTATRASDGAGGSTLTWAATQTDVPYYARSASRRGPSGSAESAQAGRVQGTDAWIVELPPGTTIAASDRLELARGELLEVTHVGAIATIELYRSVDCVEVH